MAITKVSDMLVPVVTADYITVRTAELSALWQSGIIADVGNDEIRAVLDKGKTVNMPFFNDLTGSEQILSDTADLTINKVTTGQDVAAVCERAQVFGVTDLAVDFSGADPARVIGDGWAAYWARRYQAQLIQMLAGAMGAVTANVLNISALSGAASVIDADAVIDATGLLGDSQEGLAAIAMHGAVYTALKKQNLIDFVPTADQSATIPFYLGKQVIVDDGMPVSSGTYTTYLFARGAIGFVEGSPKVPFEVGRDPLLNGGQEYMVSRKKYVLHPRGIAWTPGSGVPASATPSNAEFAASANWTRKYEAKQIRIVQLKHKI